MSRYIYDGALNERTAEYCENMMRSYHHAIEITKLPDNWIQWQEANMVDYVQTVEDCMGNSHPHKTKMYGYVQRDFSGDSHMFLFFNSWDERNNFVTAFPELVVNENPFKTVLKKVPDEPLRPPLTLTYYESPWAWLKRLVGWA